MNKPEHVSRIAALMLVAALTHVWVIPTALSPAPDTLAFIRIAQRFRSEPFLKVVRDEPQHPLYPVLVAGTEWSVRRVAGWQGPECWRVSAQVVATAIAVLLVLPLYGLIRELFDWRIAWWGTLVFLLLPTPNRITADGLSDGLHLLWFTVGLWAAARAWTRQRPVWLGAAGAAAGLGFWTRPEAIVLPVAAVALLLVMQCIRTQRWSWPAAALGILSLVVGASPFVLPYAVAKGGRLSGKGAVRLLLSSPQVDPHKPVGSDDEEAGVRRDSEARRIDPTVVNTQGNVARADTAAIAAHVAGDKTRRAPIAIDAARGCARAAAATLHEFLDATHYWPVLLAIWAIVVPWGQRSAKPAAYLLAIVAALHTLVLLRLYLVTSYVASRHVLLLVLAICPWAGSGMVLWIDRVDQIASGLAERIRMRANDARLRSAVRLAFACVLAAASLPKMLQPLHQSRWGHRQAANWLAEHGQPGVSLLDHHGISSFYTGLKGYSHQELTIAQQDPNLRFVVMESHDLARSDPLYLEVRQFVARLGAPRASFPLFEGGREPGVFVFEYHPRPNSG